MFNFAPSYNFKNKLLLSIYIYLFLSSGNFLFFFEINFILRMREVDPSLDMHKRSR
jgi:hypothetical protein